MSHLQFPGLNRAPDTAFGHDVARLLRLLLLGKMNNQGDITLSASQSAIVITDKRITIASGITLWASDTAGSLATARYFQTVSANGAATMRFDTPPGAVCTLKYGITG